MTSVLSPPVAVRWPREEADMHTIKFTHPITVDDLESFPDALRVELHEGNLHIMPPAVFWHNDVASRITQTLRQAGMVAAHEVGVRFSDIDSRVPDAAALKTVPDEEQAYFPPSNFLIVVEVVSKSSEEQDRFLKPIHYAKAGIPEYWRVEGLPEDIDDALIHQHKLSVDRAYVETGVVRLSELEASLTRR
jgi:Uma2 family endonuclease